MLPPISLETLGENLMATEYDGETVRDRGTRSRAFIDGFEVALFLFKMRNYRSHRGAMGPLCKSDKTYIQACHAATYDSSSDEYTTVMRLTEHEYTVILVSSNDEHTAACGTTMSVCVAVCRATNEFVRHYADLLRM